MITAPELEIAVLVLGMVILMLEAFATEIDKCFLAFAAITGLAAVLVASFFSRPTGPVKGTAFWGFFTRDGLWIFFKKFGLLTTVLVLILLFVYSPVGRR